MEKNLILLSYNNISSQTNPLHLWVFIAFDCIGKFILKKIS